MRTWPCITPKPAEETRITSYNVCYTKLLRVVTTEYQELTWKEAKAAAQDLPAYIDNGVAHYPHLATITSQDEQDFLYSKVHSITTNWLWIGLYQIEGSYDPKEGWTWVTGEDFVYSNWNPGEPNSYNFV